MKRTVFAGWVCAVALAAPAARAALTDSEKAQIQGFIRGAEIGSAPRVRSLVARPDLSVEEAAEPLAAGYAAVVFDDKRAAFTREVLLGAGSAASRSAIAPAIVRGLLARASRVIAQMPAADTGRDALRAASSARELVRIHRFVAEHIANAGRPPADGHDGHAGFRDDSLKEALAAYRQHIESHPRDLKHGVKLPASMVPVRAQTQLTAVDLARGLVPRRELSPVLGLEGARRGLFDRHGTLVEDGGSASDARLTAAIRFLESAPRAADGLSLWLLSKAPALGLSARGSRGAARMTLGASDATATDAALWPAEVEPARPDRELAEVAHSAALVIARAALRAAPSLEAVVDRVAVRAARAGAPGYLSRDLPESVLVPIGAESVGAHGASAELFLAHALRLVLLDAERAVTLAAVRASQGRDEPAAALVLALTALAEVGGSADELAVGRTLPNGNVEGAVIRGVQKTNGLVREFEVGGKKFEIALASEGRVDKLRVDGQEPKLSKLPLARLLPTPGESWTVNGLRLEKLSGAPLGLSVDDGRFVLGAPEKSGGFDAVVTGASAADQAVHARIRPTKRGGGLLVRGQAGATSYDGIALLVSAEPALVARLVLVDGKSNATELAPGIELAASADGYLLGLSAKGKRITGSVDGKKLEADLSRGVGKGRIGLAVAYDGRIEVSDFGAGPPKAAPRKVEQPKKPTPTREKK